uniref:Protein croquemort n=1 Tax=Timema genevievae TaxID=629358 RepID=A0A7R9PR88_TIMGE|nr:unnamed protein product [Timema genevievae]
MKLSAHAQKGWIFGCGGALFVIGVVLGGCWSLIFSKILATQLGLTPHSTSYDMWKETPVPMYMEFYLFNWTNADIFANASSDLTDIKPTFVEMGPYVFSEHHVRVNMSWNSNDTVTFMQTRTWKFVPERSNGMLTDEVTTVNTIAAAVRYISHNYNSFLVTLATNGLLRNYGSVSVTKTAGELLLDGYDDPLLDHLIQIIDTLGPSLNLTFNIPFDKFGWFSERNNSASYDGLFNMYTGTDDLSKLGMMYSWNYEHQSHYYNESCGLVRGTTGEICAPVKDMETLDVFSPDVCGSLTLKKVGELETMGITGSKFEADASIFDNGTLYPSQTCYTTGESVYSGVMNISTCKWGAPAFISYPHFYLADKSYLDAVEGLSPSSKDHNFYFAVEPEMGVPLQVRARMQINILVDPYTGSNIPLFKNLPNRVFLPAMWFTQSVDIDDKLSSTVKTALIAKTAGWGVLFSLAAVGLILLIIGLVITLRHGWAQNMVRTLVPKISQ